MKTLSHYYIIPLCNPWASFKVIKKCNYNKHLYPKSILHCPGIETAGATVVQEVEKSFSNQKVASSIPCRSVLEQDTEPLIAPDVQCAISVNVKCVYIV